MHYMRSEMRMYDKRMGIKTGKPEKEKVSTMLLSISQVDYASRISTGTSSSNSCSNSCGQSASSGSSGHSSGSSSSGR